MTKQTTHFWHNPEGKEDFRLERQRIDFDAAGLEHSQVERSHARAPFSCCRRHDRHRLAWLERLGLFLHDQLILGDARHDFNFAAAPES